LKSPAAESFHKALTVDLDTIAKNVVKAFDKEIGVGRLSTATLLISLVDLYRLNPNVLAHRLIKLKDKPDAMDAASAKWIKAMGFADFNTQSTSIVIDDLMPFALLSAFLVKYHSQDRIQGLFEAYNVCQFLKADDDL
jgi:hypothetical protein